VIAQVRTDTENARDLPLLVKVFQLLRKRQVDEAIAIVGQEFIFPFEVLLYCFQALADIGIDSCIRKGDPPVLDITPCARTLSIALTTVCLRLYVGITEAN
jgi:hypothetical protein